MEKKKRRLKTLIVFCFFTYIGYRWEFRIFKVLPKPPKEENWQKKIPHKSERRTLDHNNESEIVSISETWDKFS